MFPTTPYTGYSADIRLELRVNGQTLSLAQIGPEFVIFKHAADLPPCEAEIVMHVDGQERRWPVELPDGASSSDDLARTSAIEPAASSRAV